MYRRTVVPPLVAALAAVLVLVAAPASARGQLAPGDRPIPNWLILGPFPVDTGRARVPHAYVPGEADVLPAPGVAPSGVPDSLRWTEVAADSLGRVELTHVYRRAVDRSAAYAAVYITSPDERTVLLEIRSDDDAEAWLGRQRILLHEVARGLTTGADTVTLRLARGTNRLLYKVVNRSGGFGFGGVLLAESPDSIGDLRLSAAPPPNVALVAPAPTVTLGPVGIAPRVVLDAESGALDVSAHVTAVRWGGLTAPATLSLDTATAPLDTGRVTRAVLHGRWSRLAAAASVGLLDARVDMQAGHGVVAPRPLALTRAPDALLTALSRPIVIHGWLTTRSRAASSAPPDAWFPVPAHDSTAAADSTLTALVLNTRVPAPLAGLTLRLDVAEFDRGAAFTLDGAPTAPDSLGRITVCDPCKAGAPLDVAIDLRGVTWWDPPRLLVADPGWAEVRAGAHWLRALGGDTAIAPPDDDVARALLADAERPGKRAYHATIRSWLERLTPAAAAVRADTIGIVGNSHIDAAWLWRWRTTVGVVERTWGTAVKLMDKYPEMHFAASAAVYYEWLEQKDPALLRRIEVLEKQGRWDAVGGWWLESDANLPSGESLVRQGLYGQRAYIRWFGHPATVGWLPDSFGYDWQLPQIMRGQGLEFFVTQKLRWNDTDAWPASLNVFWWQGLDGTRILAYIPYGYSSELRAGELAHDWRVTRDSSADARLYVLYGVGDHGGGPTMTMLDRRRELQRVPTFPVLRDISPRTVLGGMRDSLEAEAAAPAPYPGGGAEPAGAAPVVDDELYLEYHRGTYTTQSQMKWWNRHMEGLLDAAEAAATTARARVPGYVYPHRRLADAWRTTLFNQFHDLLPGSGIDSIYRDATVGYARARRGADSVLTAALRALASRFDTRPPHPRLTPFLVFNPSGHARHEVVGVPAADITERTGRGGRRRVVHVPASALAAYDRAGHRLRSAARGDTLGVLAPEVPATGAVIVFVGPARGRGRVRPTERAPLSRPGTAARTASLPGGATGAGAAGDSVVVMENDALRVEISRASGDIVRLFDKRLQRDLFQPGGPGNGLVMLHDMPASWDAWNIGDRLHGARTWLDRDVHVSALRRDALGQSVTVTRAAGSVRASQRYTLPDSAAAIVVDNTIDWHQAHEFLKAVFPLAFRVDSVQAEIPYGVITRTTRPATSRDSARFEAPMQRWVDASDDTVGVAIVNESKYGYDAHGDTLRLSLLRSPKYPDSTADMGVHRFRYAIVAHAGDFRAPAIRDMAQRLNEPLRAVAVGEHTAAGGAAGRRGAVVVEGDGVRLGALKRAEDGGATVIRVVETHGRATTAVLRFPGRGRITVQPTDLIERPTGAPIQGDDGSVIIELAPWQIRTFELLDGK